MDFANINLNNNLDVLTEKLKHNVNKEAFLDIVLEAINEFKKTQYDNAKVRDFFYNLVFDTVFSMNEDYSYVMEYIAFFKSNVPFYLERFEAVINNLKSGTIHFDNAGETSVLDEDFWEANAAAAIADTAQKGYAQEEYQEEQEEVANDDTMVLSESFWSERQQLFGGNEQAANQPYLIRENTDERIDIDKPVCSIGQDRNLVDYVIEANSVISRRHATLFYL